MIASPAARHRSLSLLPLELSLEPALAETPPAEAGYRCHEPVRDDDAGELVAPGCGWFDSSFELRQGLEVVELTLPERWPFDPPPWARH